MIFNYAGNTERASTALRGCQKTLIKLNARPCFTQPFNLPINYAVNTDYFHGEPKCHPDNLAGKHTSPDQAQPHYDKFVINEIVIFRSCDRCSIACGHCSVIPSLFKLWLMEVTVTTDLLPVDETLDLRSSSPRIHTSHFNSKTQWPLHGS